MFSHGAFLFNGSFQCMDYIELSFFKVQPDVAKGVLVELYWEMFYFFVFGWFLVLCVLFLFFFRLILHACVINNLGRQGLGCV